MSSSENTYQDIDFHRSDRIAWITLNRPEMLNAVSFGGLAEIDHALDAVEADGETRVLVITGKGRAFCAGADLKGVVGKATGSSGGDTETGTDLFLRTIQALLARIRAFPMPVIAAINGIAMAGGLELAMAADILLAAEGAKIGDAHANFGVIPGAGGAAVLPRIVGPVVAKYLLFTGEALLARDLQQAGLIAKVYPDDRFLDEVRAVAVRISEKSPLGLRITKQLVAEGASLSVCDALRLELEANEGYGRSYDIREGMAAFAERRKPEFQGR